eukprot:746663-Hanusia_phi.AAC.5
MAAASKTASPQETADAMTAARPARSPPSPGTPFVNQPSKASPDRLYEPPTPLSLIYSDYPNFPWKVPHLCSHRNLLYPSTHSSYPRFS